MASDKCPFCGKGKEDYPKCAFCKKEESAQGDIKPKTERKTGADQKLKQKLSDQVLKQKSPEIYTLVQKADIALKEKNLSNHSARVALCLDISASMASLYRSGKVQTLAERILALGCRFDDNGAIDVFLFGSSSHEAGAMTIENFKGFIKHITDKYPLEGGTRYGLAIETIRKFYFPDAGGQRRDQPMRADSPVYVMFITDGETLDQQYTETQIKWAAYEAIFWQFMGLGESKKDIKSKGIKGFFSRMVRPDFGFLEQLDEMSGRFVDNANFFSIKDPADIADDELYALMMGEYPEWLKIARAKGLLKS